MDGYGLSFDAGSPLGIEMFFCCCCDDILIRLWKRNCRSGSFHGDVREMSATAMRVAGVSTRARHWVGG